VDVSPEPLGWDVIAGEDLLELLRRAAAGEDPDMLYAEHYANATRKESDDNAD
jgi:hypothetical protein